MKELEPIPGKLVVTLIRNTNTSVFVVDIQTGDSINLTNNYNHSRYGDVSPDGKNLAFIADMGGSANLFVMDLDTKSVKQLTFAAKGEVCYMPCWTKDNKTIVFGLHGEKALMASVSPNGGAVNIIGEGHDPHVSPDGKKIVYTSDTQGGYFVSTCNFDGTGCKQITFNINTIGGVFPMWSPDGQSILYADLANENLEIFKCNANGANIQQLTRLKKACTPAAWAPDGKNITFRCTDKPFWIDPDASRKVYSERRADTRPVFIMDADGNNSRVIEPLHYQCAMDGSRPNWLPVNKTIILL